MTPRIGLHHQQLLQQREMDSTTETHNIQEGKNPGTNRPITMLATLFIGELQGLQCMTFQSFPYTGSVYSRIFEGITVLRLGHGSCLLIAALPDFGHPPLPTFVLTNTSGALKSISSVQTSRRGRRSLKSRLLREGAEGLRSCIDFGACPKVPELDVNFVARSKCSEVPATKGHGKHTFAHVA